MPRDEFSPEERGHFLHHLTEQLLFIDQEGITLLLQQSNRALTDFYEELLRRKEGGPGDA